MISGWDRAVRHGVIPDMLPKMMISISGATHFSWFGPDAAGRGPLLTMQPMSGMMKTNIK